MVYMGCKKSSYSGVPYSQVYQGGHIRTYFAVLLIFGKSFIVETKIFFENNPHYLSQHEH
jgi:hypothetical protein